MSRNNIQAAFVSAYQIAGNVLTGLRQDRELSKRRAVGSRVLRLETGALDSSLNAYCNREITGRVYDVSVTSSRVVEMVEAGVKSVISVDRSDPKSVTASQTFLEDGRTFEYPPVDPNLALSLHDVAGMVATAEAVRTARLITCV